MSVELHCITCGKVVKVNRYGKMSKKPNKNSNFGNADNYSCSKCRGIVPPEKIKKYIITGKDKIRDRNYPTNYC